MAAPLADRLRPENLCDVVGQEHILGPEKPLPRMIASGHLPNLIFYGPSGVGKTTVARIVASCTGKSLYRLSGTSASTADIKSVIGDLDTIRGVDGVVLYLDEIQYLNKKQQQTLLEFIENGRITLIAATTENPYFYVYNAILSRCTILEFHPVGFKDIERAVLRAFSILESESSQRAVISQETLEIICRRSGGDVRKALGAVEFLWYSSAPIDGERVILEETARQVTQRSNMRYDRDGDEHYDILSAFQKSIRGSDENAALHYLARLLSAGDLISSCRRLLVTASEDIGLAYPQAAGIVKSLTESAMQLGLPEAKIPLAQAVIFLCTSPKSNSAHDAINAAMDDVQNCDIGEIPSHLKDGHYSGAKKLGNSIGYKYSHNYPNSYVKQNYLPDALLGKIYYNFGDNKIELAAKAYRKALIGDNNNPQ